MLPRHTPWGDIHDQREHAPGIVNVSTAGHGGFWLSAERLAEFRAVFPDFDPYAGEPWFEEDEDWAVVVLAFPDMFDDESTWTAVEAVPVARRISQSLYSDGANRWIPVESWLANTMVGRAAVDRAKRFKATVATMWQHGSMGSTDTPGKWWVLFTRVGDKAQRAVTMPSYPMKRFWTGAELDQFTAVAA